MSKKTKRRSPATKATAELPGISSRWCAILLAIVILFFALIRVRLLNFPLERDEGEYAYSGQLMLQGIAPYQLAYNMKLPGTYAAYALIMAIFGESPTGIHFGLLLANVGTVILLFFLASRLFGPLAGLVAGASYALLSTSESVLGLAAHATHFVALAALGGTLLLLKAFESKRMLLYFVSGFLLGIAFICKQPGIFFGLFGGTFVAWSEWQGGKNWTVWARRVGIYSVGAVLPFALTCAILAFAGVLGRMWFWAFSYGAQYATSLTLSAGWHYFSTVFVSIVKPAIFVWILAGIGVLALMWDSRARKHGAFTIGFLLFSFAAVCPGLYFRQHYFIVVLPAICLFAGITISSSVQWLSQRLRNPAATVIPLLVFGAAVGVSVAEQREVFFRMDSVQASRYIYQSNPFVEAQPVSDYIKRESKPDARIAVIGSEPEIYFYSDRHSATGYIYTYALMEPQKYALDMQKEMASEIEASRPQFLVLVHISPSWLSHPDSSSYILDWSEKYAADHYEVAGVADEGREQTYYVWGAGANSHRMHSDSYIVVFKRRND